MASIGFGAIVILRRIKGDECLRLRVKDVDFGYRQIVVRDGKKRSWRLSKDVAGGDVASIGTIAAGRSLEAIECLEAE